jgi:hypothetical protein
MEYLLARTGARLCVRLRRYREALRRSALRRCRPLFEGAWRGEVG